jgi:hypothetical protein
MAMPDSFWEENYHLNIPTSLVKGFCSADSFDKELKPEELYYILETLELQDRFAAYFNNPVFCQRLGLAHLAVKNVDKTRDDWIRQQGDFAWAAGNMDEALRLYEESIRQDDSVHSGYRGKFRICFVKKDFEECVRIFHKVCPPHSFYLEYEPLFGRNREEGFDFNEATKAVQEKYPTTSPYFITSAKYMLKAVILAATNIGSIDDKLRQMISDYFEVTEEEVDQLAILLYDNDTEYACVKKRIEPKPQKTDSATAELIEKGATEKAKKLCERLLNYEKIIADVTSSIIRFLQNGDEAILDEIINLNPPFGISGADRIIFDAVFKSIGEQVGQKPERQLILMRRFNRICGYPRGRNMLRSDNWCHEGGFWDVFRNIMLNTESKMLRSDILLCLQNFRNSENMFVDHVFIEENFEWCNAMLESYAALNRDFLKDEDETNNTLYEVYTYLRECYDDARNKQTWVSEELLAEAIKSLFGKDNVLQHANPIWLSPQHLDIYLPSYNLAIEYMGKQHYEPVEYFGGEKAFKENQERDRRKAELCERMNVNLVYVTHEEDIGKRAKEIFELYGAINEN